MIEAVRILKQGGLVAFPTETVYGLGADANNAEALLRLFAVKQRPKTHPLIVHIAEISQLSDWACDISSDALCLARAFWPGPLTLILAKQPWVLDTVTGQQMTVGLRIPSHPIAQALLHAFDGGIAAPSANQFTRISPTNAQAVFEELGDTVDRILDGGPCEVGLESTIIDLSEGSPRLLRPGMITEEAIAATLGKPIINKEQQNGDLSITRAPGMHALHYAPNTPTFLLTDKQIMHHVQIQKDLSKSIALIAYDTSHLPLPQEISVFLLNHHPTRYAHDLYETLRRADQSGVDAIWVQAVPTTLGWDAIRDRLQKASGARDEVTTSLRG